MDKLPIEPAPRNENELIDQVGRWSSYNFGPDRIPEFGIVEEIGEAAHAVLKYRQKIRGFDSEQKFTEYFVDALADGMIFLCDYCSIRNAFFRFKRNQQEPAITQYQERKIIAHLMQAASQMFAYDEILVGEPVEVGEQQVYNMIVQQICNGFQYWATAYNYDLPMLVSLTWEKVKHRDWKRNAVAAHAQD